MSRALWGLRGQAARQYRRSAASCGASQTLLLLFTASRGSGQTLLYRFTHIPVGAVQTLYSLPPQHYQLYAMLRLTASPVGAGETQQAVELMDQLHAAGMVGNHQLYHGLLSSCQAGVEWELALEVFLAMQVGGCGCACE